MNTLHVGWVAQTSLISFHLAIFDFDTYADFYSQQRFFYSNRVDIASACCAIHTPSFAIAIVALNVSHYQRPFNIWNVMALRIM